LPSCKPARARRCISRCCRSRLLRPHLLPQARQAPADGEVVDVDYGGLGSLTATSRFDVGVVEPDARLRLRMVGQLPGAWQLESVQELLQQFRPNRPLVAVFGPGLANSFGFQQINRLANTYPEIGAVIAVEELSTDLLQQALRSGVRDTVDLKASGDALAV